VINMEGIRITTKEDPLKWGLPAAAFAIACIINCYMIVAYCLSQEPYCKLEPSMFIVLAVLLALFGYCMKKYFEVNNDESES